MNRPTIREVAISTELIIHGHNKGFTYKEAELLAVEQLKEGNATLVDVFTTRTSDDVYELLEGDNVSQVLETHNFVGLVTTGWASPLTDDDKETWSAPSKHPERRRIRLVIIADKGNVCAVIRFSDGDDEVIVDEGSATGSLNDAFRKAIKRKRKGK